jgi:hypothetical protein
VVGFVVAQFIRHVPLRGGAPVNVEKPGVAAQAVAPAAERVTETV